jgi:ubiquitin C-terminal hydrolase
LVPYKALDSPSKTDYSMYSTPMQSPNTSGDAWAFFPVLSPTKDTTPDIPYGGLNNLGNTCYMAAGLQMLCSLDAFPNDLIARSPPDHADMKLRLAFLDVLQRLQTRTVAPNALKEAIDERSSLFLGFRQQDAHEFLTTLLDLLDEDYVKKAPTDTKDSMDEQEEMELYSDLEPSASKKPRTDLISPMEADDSAFEQSAAAEEDSIQNASSFSNLDVHAIDQLLHGESSSCLSLSEVSRSNLVEPGQPRCKLIGGRMNASDVALTPFAEFDVAHRREIMTQGDTSSTRGGDNSASHLESTDDVENDMDEAESPISTTFMTRVRIRLTCDSCKFTRCHKETFLHLSLEIDSGSTICPNIEDGLRRFFSPCTQDIKCEKCFCETATQTTEITKLPSALLLNLKRFIVDVSSGWSDVSYRKDQSAVHFDENLTMDKDIGVLSEFLASDCTFPEAVVRPQRYTLRSVVNHIGWSATGGHYTADAKRRYGENLEWTRFNDCHVSKISPTQAIEESRQTAYMCLYELE